MASDMPAAEVDIDATLVRRLLDEQAPQHSHERIRAVAFGWDNVSFRVGETLVARLPRRAISVPLIDHEAQWLPILAPRLPLPVPTPVFQGEPGAGYPWRWLLSRWIPGRSASLVETLDYEHVSVQLARFLRALHRPAPAAAPHNPYRGMDLIERDGTTRHRIDLLSESIDVERARETWGDAVQAAPDDLGPVWIHGDLHPHNLITSGDRLAGVIDFGDITSGDPATDLSVVWMLLPERVTPMFWDVYGRADQPTRVRARGWALALGLAIVANSADNPEMAAIGTKTLDAVLGH